MKPILARAALSVIEQLEGRRLLSAGDLDPTFSGDGMQLVDLAGSSNEIVNATVVQSDGKVVLAGRFTGAELDFFVARLNKDGSTDTTFGGGDGFLTIDFSVTDEAQDVAIDSSGRIVVVGTSSSGAGSNARNFAIARLTSAGVLDTTFSGDGRTTVDFGSNDDAMAVAIDGSAIYVGGYKDLGTTAQFLLVKLTSTGAEDTTYSGDGEVFFGFGGNNDSRCFDIAIDESSRVMMVGYDEVIGSGTGRNFAYARVGANAVLDPGFSGDGLAVTDFASGDDEARAVGIDPRGNIVAGGFSDGTGGDDFTATRLSSAGALDSSFNGDGAFRLNIGGVEAVDDLVIQPDGDITLSGQTSVGGFQAALVRLSLGSGQLSPSFGDGGDGIQLINTGAIDDGFAAALDPRDSRVVVAGTDGSGKLSIARVTDLVDTNFANSRPNIKRLRMLPDGRLLASSASGIHRILISGADDPTFAASPMETISDFAIDNLGRIITVNSQNPDDGDGFIRVRRLLKDGAPDTSFSGDGVFDFTFTNANNDASISQAVAIDSSDRIVIAGTEGIYVAGVLSGDPAVARITTSGALDASFDNDGINVIGVDAIADFTAVVIAPDGKIIAAGTDFQTGGDTVSVVRLLTNGNRDLGFGTLGIQRFSFGLGENPDTRGVTVDSSGRIIVVGSTTHTESGDLVARSFVSRLTTGGGLDSSFDGDGSILLTIADDGFDNTDRVAIDSAGRILTVGTFARPDSGDYFTVVRRLIPGAAVVGDNTFASDGVWMDTQTAVPPIFYPHENDVLVDAGAIYVSGGVNGIRRLNVDPAIVDFEFRFETAPQSLRVSFNDDVSATLSDLDLLVHNDTTNQTVTTAGYDLVSYDAQTNQAVFNFNSILTDGNYAVTFNSPGIANRQSELLGGDRVREFFFQMGDATRDRMADTVDFNILVSNFGKTGKTFSEGNFSYDAPGSVDTVDFNLLVSRFGKSLPVPAAPLAPAPPAPAPPAAAGAPQRAEFFSQTLIDLLN